MYFGIFEVWGGFLGRRVIGKELGTHTGNWVATCTLCLRNNFGGLHGFSGICLRVEIWVFRGLKWGQMGDTIVKPCDAISGKVRILVRCFG